jgi:hypothetical protein
MANINQISSLEGQQFSLPNETQKNLYDSFQPLISSQTNNLLNQAQTLSKSQLKRVLEENKQALYQAIDRSPKTAILSEKEKSTFVSGIIDAQAALVSTKIQSPTVKGLKSIRKMQNDGVSAPLKLFSSPLQQAPASEDTLTIDGVSVYVWKAPNGETLYIPVGHSTQGGDTKSPSEAWGYAMRNAVEAKDKDFFEKMAKSYLYFCNQSAAFTNMFGLMGWNPDMATGSYSNTSEATSASDADEDIIGALIDGLKKFGDMQISDTISTLPNAHHSISLKDLTMNAVQSFIHGCGNGTGDIGSFSFNGKTYSPILTLDGWGHDGVFPDYFDPIIFSKMMSFLSENNQDGKYTQDIATVKAAAQNTMQFIMDISDASNGWIGDTLWTTPASSSNFGYDATRILMRLGQFIATPGAKDLFGETMFNQAVTTLQRLVTNISPYVQGNQFTPTGLNGGCFTGPFLTALTALKAIGKLPSSISDAMIQKIYTAFQNDLQNYSIDGGTKGWQYNGYFNIQLAVLSEAIMKDLGIFPG